MDVVVTSKGEITWQLNDRLGRLLGEIQQPVAGTYTILPVPKSALLGIRPSPYASLQDAMSAIEIHKGSVPTLHGRRIGYKACSRLREFPILRSCHRWG
jgi:hypothetical protein